MRRDDEILRVFLPDPSRCGPLLDCAAGIGSQAIALAQRGYLVEGSDQSENSIDRARRYAAELGLQIPFRIDDVCSLKTAPDNYYGAILALDNLLPNLGSHDQMRVAIHALHQRLRSGGVLITAIRDYDPVLATRPNGLPPRISGNGTGRRIFHEVWDWHDDRHYTSHVYVTKEVAHHWEVKHFTGNYCAILKCEMADLFRQEGFAKVDILPTDETGFHQPLIRGLKR